MRARVRGEGEVVVGEEAPVGEDVGRDVEAEVFPYLVRDVLGRLPGVHHPVYYLVGLPEGGVDR